MARGMTGDDDRTVDLLLAQHVDQVLFLLDVLVGIGKDDLVAVRLGDVLYAAHFGRKQGIEDVRDQQADRVGSTAAQAARERISVDTRVHERQREPAPVLPQRPSCVR